MTLSSSSRWARGWNNPSVTGETNLWIYVDAKGNAQGWFRGRIDGNLERIRLEGDTLTEWKRACRVLGGSDDAASAVGSKTKLGEYALGDYCISQRKLIGHIEASKRRSRRSVEEDERVIRTYIADSKLGRMKFADIRIAHVRAWKDGLYDLRKADGSQYAPGTLGNMVRILGSIFREAKLAGHTSHNFVRELEHGERPSRRRVGIKRYLTPQQVDLLLSKVSKVFYPILVVCAWAGLRISEALGLTWADIDLEKRTIRIAQQLDIGADGGRVGLKTMNSYATIPMMPQVFALLQKHRREMMERGLHLVAPDALVFVTSTGGHQSRRNVLRGLHLAGDKAGLNVDKDGTEIKKVDIHSLRHSLGSNALKMGFTVSEVALLLRDTEKTVVANYLAVPEEERAGLADKLAERLGRTGTE